MKLFAKTRIRLLCCLLIIAYFCIAGKTLFLLTVRRARGLVPTRLGTEVNNITEKVCGQLDYGAYKLFRRFSVTDDNHLKRDKDRGMLSRYLTVDENCPTEKLNSTWPVLSHLLVSIHFKFSMCFVPKVGCTFWKTVLHLLENPNISPENFTSRLLTKIDKKSIHLIGLPFMGSSRLPSPESFHRTSKSVVFTRNPYTRLFSAYINKFALHSFWRLVGINIIKLTRQKASAKSLQCGHDVTFEEFLRYVVHVQETGVITMETADDHWAPVTSLCDVCQMKYDYIGKLESFSSDMDYVFHQLGLEKFLVKDMIPEDMVRLSVQETVSIDWWKGPSACVTRSEALHRLWYSLQTRGYMTMTSEPPWQHLDLSTAQTADVVQAFLSAYDRDKPTSAQVKRQAHHALITAYKTVPIQLKRRIQHAFRFDFILFDYDNEPEELFSEN